MIIWCSWVAKEVNNQPRAMARPPRKAARRGDLWRQKDMITGEKSWEVERQEETTSAGKHIMVKKMFCLNQAPVVILLVSSPTLALILSTMTCPWDMINPMLSTFMMREVIKTFHPHPPSG